MYNIFEHLRGTEEIFNNEITGINTFLTPHLNTIISNENLFQDLFIELNTEIVTLMNEENFGYLMV
jgi:hypothetical protein